MEVTMPDPKIFRAPFAPDDAALLKTFIEDTQAGVDHDKSVDEEARALIEAIRGHHSSLGTVEDFLREYGLSTREGLALMTLAEALLRVPDATTADRLIEDKLTHADWASHQGHDDLWLINASTWALGIANHIVKRDETPASVLYGLMQRLGRPAVRTATKQAMRLLGNQFVLAETIETALERAATKQEKGYLFSYDMLGEGARTHEDAASYFEHYKKALHAIGKRSGNKELPDRPGLSVKLSALYPRYEATHQADVMQALVPRLTELAISAKGYNLNLTMDAEEADRLELSLDIFRGVAANPDLEGWHGFGLAVQAYQKRAIEVIHWLDNLSQSLDRCFMVRLVKGAYWDTEIKRAQERGLVDYPVFTRKAATDVSYLACAKALLDARPRLYPQFATHNALTVAQILSLAGINQSTQSSNNFEFQRLHGMGEGLYTALKQRHPQTRCRIYAPVGGHRDLLAYLVRRLLENGANSSFVAIVGDEDIPIETLLKRPSAIIEGGKAARHPSIPLPRDIVPGRKIAHGFELGLESDRTILFDKMRALSLPLKDAAPLINGEQQSGTSKPVISPVDGTTHIGIIIEADIATADKAIESAHKAFTAFSKMPVEARAKALEATANRLEKDIGWWVALLAKEAGKTITDGIADIREAIDFLRYYAQEARTLFTDKTLPGPTGEINIYHYRPRGVVVAISPWNFPVAIFTGQIVAALATGNTVVAKPAEQTPLCAFHLVQLLHECGIPQDALQFVPGDGRIGARLVAHSKTALVVFTGSTETARHINRQLANKQGSITPLIAETGGINAMIVDATALPEQVSDDVMASAFRSAGQRCSALRLMFVQEEAMPRILTMLKGATACLTLGDPSDISTDIGPVIDKEAQAAILHHIETMKQEQEILYPPYQPNDTTLFQQKGVPVLPPEKRQNKGFWVPPHIIRLKQASDLKKEIFGPVLHVVSWKTGDLPNVLEAIHNTGYALTLGIHSRIESRVDKIITALDTGNIYVNRNQIGAIVGMQPFGGSGLSGTGPKAGGPDYLRRFCIEQVISTNTAAAGGNASLMTLSE
jgi:RHH-type proline utilization regulon transcriptional repressor/proline dehydrogenase/delta 1-pyrroline-5-carboxylate dehydrogenase